MLFCPGSWIVREYFHPACSYGYLLYCSRSTIGMNRRVHLVIGLVLFFLYFYFIIIFSVSASMSLLYGIFANMIGSVFPDILEPPSGRMHRRICHSKRALKFSFLAFSLTAFLCLYPLSAPGYSVPSFIASGFFLGYFFHLLADSLTRAGLPY
jgi:membrane-bound metal-dependent hydrolase YbcI (DUF457 family)